MCCTPLAWAYQGATHRAMREQALLPSTTYRATCSRRSLFPVGVWGPWWASKRVEPWFTAKGLQRVRSWGGSVRRGCSTERRVNRGRTEQQEAPSTKGVAYERCERAPRTNAACGTRAAGVVAAAVCYGILTFRPWYPTPLCTVCSFFNLQSLIFNSF
jgi:hypothetical protein